MHEKMGKSRKRSQVDERGLDPRETWKNWPLTRAPLCSLLYLDGQLGQPGLWNQSYGT